MRAESAERRQCRLIHFTCFAPIADFGTVSEQHSSFSSDHQFCTNHSAMGNAGKYRRVRSLSIDLSQIVDTIRRSTRMPSAHHVSRSTGSVAAGWATGSHSNNRDFDTWRRLQLINRRGILPRIIDWETVVVARTFIRQTGFVQDSIDPNPSAHWKCAAEIADATCTYCSPERPQQPGPMLLIVPIALRLVRAPGWRSCRRHISLMNPIASVRHARSDFVRRANAVRPITDLAALDSTLIMGSPRHHPIVITHRAAVCLTWPSASMISYFTISRVCPGHSRERPKAPPSFQHPELLLSFSPIRAAGKDGWPHLGPRKSHLFSPGLSLRPPDPGTGRVAGRTSYLLAETGFERSLSERTRSLSEKQVKADKDLRRSAEERFFVFRGFRTFCLTAKSVS